MMSGSNQTYKKPTLFENVMYVVFAICLVAAFIVTPLDVIYGWGVIVVAVTVFAILLLVRRYLL